jgi:hypothetical protein
MISSRKIKCLGRVSHMGKTRIHTRFKSESMKGAGNLGDVGVEG